MHPEKPATLVSPAPTRAWPWLTVAASVAAIAVWLLAGLRESFLYERTAIASGQWWRLWTGHLAHHGGSHLVWNLAVFLPVGVWLERLRPRSARVFLIVAPLAISAALWYFEPALRFYAGLSGVTVGMLTLLACVQLRRRSDEPRWLWAALLALIAAKIVFEFARPASSLFAGLPDGVRNVPLAHLAGAICAVAVFLATFRRSNR